MFYDNGTLLSFSVLFYPAKRWSLVETGSLHLSSLWLVWHHCRGATLYASRLSSPASVEGLLLVVFLCYFLKASSPLLAVFICDVHQYWVQLFFLYLLETGERSGKTGKYAEPYVFLWYVCIMRDCKSVQKLEVSLRINFHVVRESKI